jgi:hypothetical protein
MKEIDPLVRIKELKNDASMHFERVNCYVCGSSKSQEFLIGEEDLTGKDGEFPVSYTHLRAHETG